MHPEAMQWVAEHATKVGSPVRVMDQGGQNVNGSIRELFPTATDWTSVDMFNGEGVDVVADCEVALDRCLDFVTAVRHSCRSLRPVASPH